MVSRARSSVMANLFLINFTIRDAWAGRKDTTKEEAQKAYVDKLIAVCPPTISLSCPITHPFRFWKRTLTTRTRRNTLPSSNKQG